MRALGEAGRAGGRWRARALIPALLCAVGGGALSCFGDCPPNTEPVTPPPRAPLRPRYVLVTAGGRAIPAVLAEGGGMRVRLLADTLLFTIGADSTRGTYTETVVLGVLDGSGAERVSRTVSPSGNWTRTQDGQFTLSALSGGGPTAPANGSLFENGGAVKVSVLSLFTGDARNYGFEAR
jgi:hypothetical protein